MDVCLVIKHRLEELGLEQQDLAAAAEVTDSYISQLLNRKKLPPAPDRTDIYAKMDRFLKLPRGKLSTLAEHQRKEELKKILDGPAAPLHKEVRELILRKVAPDNCSLTAEKRHYNAGQGAGAAGAKTKGKVVKSFPRHRSDDWQKKRIQVSSQAPFAFDFSC